MTIATKDGTTLRIPLEAGIVGYCIKHEVVMNIQDAYEDKRFNKQIDLETGYRTKSILCVPIKDENNKLIGNYV